MRPIQIYWHPEMLSYTGGELRPHFIYKKFGVLGDAAVAFSGPCKVPIESMIDLEDVRQNRPIYSEEMLHFLMEHFGVGLSEIVLLQRLAIAIVHEKLIDSKIPKLIRKGDDLYQEDKKWSVSIASVSLTSGLIHIGINLSSKNTPVPTGGLQDYQIDPEVFARSVLEAYQAEIASMIRAMSKVKGVLTS